MNRKRILVLTSTFPRWESDTEPAFVFDLCKNLNNYGYDIDVIAPHSPGAELEEILDGINVRRYRYFIPALQKLAYSGGILANLKKNPLQYLVVPFFLIFQFIAIVKRLGANRYDLIHAHWIVPQGLLCAVANKFSKVIPVPLICTSHGADLYSLRNLFFRILKKWTINGCAHLCVVSHAMKERCLTMGVDDSRVSVISMGVDLDNMFVPVEGIERKQNRLIFVGRLVEKKGVSILIDAMKLITENIPETELLVIGDGPLRNSLIEKVEKSGLSENILFKGSVTNDRLPALYSSASIAVIPSIIDSSGDQEGLGLVIIEALGCGCAVVASSLDPIKDVIRDEITSMLFTPGNSRELAEKISLLLKNPPLCNEMAARGRESVAREYNWKIVSSKYRQLIEVTCNQSHYSCSSNKFI